jgi:hypothetical protein
MFNRDFLNTLFLRNLTSILDEGLLFSVSYLGIGQLSQANVNVGFSKSKGGEMQVSIAGFIIT